MQAEGCEEAQDREEDTTLKAAQSLARSLTTDVRPRHHFPSPSSAAHDSAGSWWAVVTTPQSPLIRHTAGLAQVELPAAPLHCA